MRGQFDQLVPQHLIVVEPKRQGLGNPPSLRRQRHRGGGEFEFDDGDV